MDPQQLQLSHNDSEIRELYLGHEKTFDLLSLVPVQKMYLLNDYFIYYNEKVITNLPTTTIFQACRLVHRFITPWPPPSISKWGHPVIKMPSYRLNRLVSL